MVQWLWITFSRSRFWVQNFSQNSSSSLHDVFKRTLPQMLIWAKRWILGCCIYATLPTSLVKLSWKKQKCQAKFPRSKFNEMGSFFSWMHLSRRTKPYGKVTKRGIPNVLPSILPIGIFMKSLPNFIYWLLSFSWHLPNIA